MQIKTIKGIYESNTYVMTSVSEAQRFRQKSVIESNGVKIIIEAGAPVDSLRQALGGTAPAAIFLTHEHFDHVAHIADYATAFPNCPIYCHPATLQELKTGEINRILGAFAGVDVEPPDSFKNFHALTDNQIINIGPLEIKAIFAPGHSDGSILYSIKNSPLERRGGTEGDGVVLFTSDVLFNNTIGRTDLIPNGQTQMQKTLRTLQTLKFETAYHGHGNPSSYEEQQQNIANHIN